MQTFKKILIIYILIFYIGLIYSQKVEKVLPNFLDCNILSNKHLDESDYTLVIVSGAGCGYCELAMKQLMQYKNREKINIIIYEFGTIEAIRNLHSKYFNDFIFVEANTCKYYSNKIFPLYFLYYKNKLIWKQTKYKTNTLETLNEKIYL
mgnify:CR=1 FL=1